MQGLGYGSSRKSSRQSRSRSKKRQKTAGDLNQPLSVSSCTDTYTSDSDDSDYSYSEVSEPKKAGAGPRLEKDEVQHFELLSMETHKPWRGHCSTQRFGEPVSNLLKPRWRVGLQMNARYVVSKFLGDGTFGRVLQAKDCKRNRQVAIKIIRNEPHSALSNKRLQVNWNSSYHARELPQDCFLNSGVICALVTD